MDQHTNQTQEQTTQHVYQQPYQQPYPYAPPKPPASGYAVASLVLGILSIVLWWIPIVNIIISILGLVFAIITKKRGNRGGMGTAGLVCSIIGTVFSLWIVIWLFVGLIWLGSSDFNHFFHDFM